MGNRLPVPQSQMGLGEGRNAVKVCIYGLGAIGGWLAYKLAKAKLPVDVTAIARGRILEAVGDSGISVQDDNRLSTANVKVSGDPALLGEQDIVLLTIKGTALLDVSEHIQPLIGPHTLVVSCMNGIPWWFSQVGPFAQNPIPLPSIDPDGSVAKTIPPSQCLGMLVHASCSVLGAGLVRHHAGNRVVLGDPSDAHSVRVQEVASLLSSTGLDVVVSDEVHAEILYKLWGNLTSGPIAVLTEATLDRQLDCQLVRNFSRQVMDEVSEIARQLGIPLSSLPEEKLRMSRRLGAITPSMLQDSKAGKPLELEAFFGPVRDLARFTSTATPFIDALEGLLRLTSRAYSPSSSNTGKPAKETRGSRRVREKYSHGV